MWILPSLLTSFFETGTDILAKKTSDKTNVYVSAFALQFFAMLVLLPFILFTGIPHLTDSYWLAILISCIGMPSWSIMYINAIKLSHLSEAIPLLAFNPVFTAMLAIFFEKRFPDPFGWMAIIAIATGFYLLRFETQNGKKSLLQPIVSIRNEPGSLSMLGVALIWSLGAHISKIGTAGSSPLFYAFSITSVGTFFLFIIALYKGAFYTKISRSTWFFLMPVGILKGLSELSFNYALTFGFVPYVVTIKRTNLLWSSLIGIFIFKENLTRLKLSGLILMVLGVAGLMIL